VNGKGALAQKSLFS